MDCFIPDEEIEIEMGLNLGKMRMLLALCGR
jgi:hypothetical protein